MPAAVLPTAKSLAVFSLKPQSDRLLGRLSPQEIRGIRNTYSFTQQEWAEVTGFGLASIKRWETGSWIQNEAADRLLWLLTHKEVFSKLSMYKSPSEGRRNFSFQTKIQEDENVSYRAQVFNLRPTRAAA